MSASASGTIYASERFGVPQSLTAVMGLGAALSALLERIHPCEAVPPRAPQWELHLARGCERGLSPALPIGAQRAPKPPATEASIRIKPWAHASVVPRAGLLSASRYCP